MPYTFKLAFAVVLIGSFHHASANVPVDSFNSANAALNPSVAVNRDKAKTPASNGPADALIRLARPRPPSIAHPPELPVEPAEP